MSKLTLKDIAEAMRDIDICMMTTKNAFHGAGITSNEQQPRS